MNLDEIKETEMINWNDIRVEQEIAQERYQTIVRARQIKQALAKSEEGQSKTPFYRWAFGWFGCKLGDLGVYFPKLQQGTGPQC
jgi:hypothetical protein